MSIKNSFYIFLFFFCFLIKDKLIFAKEERKWWHSKIEIEYQKNFKKKFLFTNKYKETESRAIFHLDVDTLTYKKILGFFLRSRNIFDSLNDTNFEIDEVFVRLKTEDGYYLKVGKQRFNWGEGSLWNPVNTIDPPKDIQDKNINRGVLALSCGKQLSNCGFLVCFMPSVNENASFLGRHFSSVPEREGIAARVNLTTLGSDFSLNLHRNGFGRNIFGGFWSGIIFDYIVAYCELSVKFSDKIYPNFLIGFRYQSPRESTAIIEYYYDEAEYNYLQIYLSATNIWDILTIGGRTIVSMDEGGVLFRGELLFTSWQNIKPYFYFVNSVGKSNGEFDLLPFEENILVGLAFYF